MFDYRSIAELCSEAAKQKTAISVIVLKDQAEQLELQEDELYAKMVKNYTVMKESIRNGSNPNLRSSSGLTGGDAAKMAAYAKGSPISGPFFTGAIQKAIAVAEYNASMGRIVAAPTAGSCGILPGAVFSMVEDKHCTEKSAVMALFTAGAFGIVIAQKASIAGAEGGCQAECGSAAGMAAAAIVEMAGGTPEMCGQACAIALKNELGLVCDPVAGLVEIPCVKRNAAGVSLAFMAADMALAGITSRIPVDEVIDAMKAVGGSIPSALKETSQGGLSQTPTALRIKEKIFGTVD